MAEPLYRSRDDKMLAGVAGGLARQFDADPSIVRLLWVVGAVVTGGLGLLLYIVMAIVIPYPPEGYIAPGADAAVGVTGGAGVGGSSTARSGDGRSAAFVVGLILVAIGALFLVRELLPDIDLSISWPVLAVVLGVVLIVSSFRPGRSPGAWPDIGRVGASRTHPPPGSAPSRPVRYA